MKHAYLFASLLTGVACTTVNAQIGTVQDFQKLSESHGDFPSILETEGGMNAVCPAGDLDGNGAPDLFAGAPFSNSVYAIMLDSEHKVASVEPVGDLSTFLGENFSGSDEFGADVASLGDLDGNGAIDLLVGSPGLSSETGAATVIMKNTDGSVADAWLLDSETEGFDYELEPGDRFGDHITTMQWPGHNGIALSISARGDDDVATDAGANYLLLLNANGSIEDVVKITGGQAGIGNILVENDQFGSGSLVPDMNSNGLPELAVGATGDDEAGSDFGAAYLIYLNGNATADSLKKITKERNGFDGFINGGDQFGMDIAGPGDLDQDGVNDLVISAPYDDEGGLDVGGMWVLLMNPDGTVRTEKAINRLYGNFAGDINFSDAFATRISAAGDLDDDGIPDLLAGSPFDDDGGDNKGAIFQLFMQYCPAPNAVYSYDQSSATFSFSLESEGEAEYLWNFDDGHYSTDQNPEHTYESNGTFNVCVTVTDECGSNQYCSVVQVTTASIAEQGKNRVVAYPNPVSTEWLNIDGIKERTPYRIMDVRGGELARGWLVGDDKIAIRDLEPGIYILQGQGAHPFSLKVVVK